MVNDRNYLMRISNQEKITAAIRSRGLTLRALDALKGLPSGATAAAIQKPYHKAERAISDFLEIPARQLWPDRYNADGTRKRPQPASNYETKARLTRANEIGR